jgi:hypothetical protein
MASCEQWPMVAVGLFYGQEYATDNKHNSILLMAIWMHGNTVKRSRGPYFVRYLWPTVAYLYSQSCEIHRLGPNTFISIDWFPHMNCNPVISLTLLHVAFIFLFSVNLLSVSWHVTAAVKQINRDMESCTGLYTERYQYSTIPKN